MCVDIFAHFRCNAVFDLRERGCKLLSVESGQSGLVPLACDADAPKSVHHLSWQCHSVNILG